MSKRNIRSILGRKISEEAICKVSIAIGGMVLLMSIYNVISVTGILG